MAAVVDAVRPHEDGSPAPGFPGRAELSPRLRSLGISGRLFYTDDACRLRVLALPDLVAGTPPDPAGRCEFSLSPGGSRVASASARWDRRGRLLARCRGGVVELAEEEGAASHGTFAGCAPAWRPGGSFRYVGEEAVQQVPGTLTLARRGEVVQVTGCGVHELPPCDRVVLSRADLRRAGRRHPNAADAVGEPSVAVRDAVWVSRSRVVLLLEVKVPLRQLREQLIAIFEGRRLVATRAYFTDGVTRLEARGSVVAAEPGEVFRADGSGIQLPRLTAVRALALSPDGRWVAAASRGAVYLVRLSAGPGIRIVDLRVAARDLAWR